MTPLALLNDKPATELIGLAKLIVPFGGLQRTGLRGGQTIIVLQGLDLTAVVP